MGVKLYTAPDSAITGVDVLAKVTEKVLATSADAVATAADRVQTGLDRIQCDAAVVRITTAGNFGSVQFNNSGVLGGATGLHWDNLNGRLGIGTTNPLYLLDVTGSARVTDTLRISGANNSLQLSGANSYVSVTDGIIINNFGRDGTGGFLGTQTAHNLTLHTSNTAKMTIDATGNVGIGTTSPQSKLHVANGFSGVTPFAGTSFALESSGSNYLFLLSPNANENSILFGSPQSNIDGGIIYNAGGTGRRLDFRTQNIARMSIDTTGNVGIGTAAPSTTLHVNGPARVGQYTVATLPSASTAGFGAIVFVSDANAVTPRSIVAGGGANKAMVWSDGANWLVAV